jgi:hypothetical protein
LGLGSQLSQSTEFSRNCAAANHDVVVNADTEVRGHSMPKGTTTPSVSTTFRCVPTFGVKMIRGRHGREVIRIRLYQGRENSSPQSPRLTTTPHRRALVRRASLSLEIKDRCLCLVIPLFSLEDKLITKRNESRRHIYQRAKWQDQILSRVR